MTALLDPLLHNLASAADQALSMIAQHIEALCASAKTCATARAKALTRSEQEIDAQ